MTHGLRAGLVALGLFAASNACWAAHAYAQFGDIKYPAGFSHFEYVNPAAPKGGAIALVAPLVASTFDKYNPFTLKGTPPPGLTSLVFETLLAGSLDEPATAYGLLADDVVVAPDGRSATFHLNPAARFHNGEPVQAADVLHSYQTLSSKLVSPRYPAFLSEVSGATVLDERRIRFDFKRPNAELPLVVGSLPVFSRKWGEGKRFDAVVTDMPIASGPYRIGPVDFGKDITYVRDAGYWARDLNVRRGQFNFERITYRLYADNVAAFEGFKAGEFDLIQSFISKDWARQYRGAKFDRGELVKGEWATQNATGFQGFVFNLRQPRFADVRVRQALGLAMDFEWMNRQLFYGSYQRLRGYFSGSDYEAKDRPGPDELALLLPLRAKLPSAVFDEPVPLPPSTEPPRSLRDNLRQARALLAQAGWTYRDGALRNARDEAFAFEILDYSPSGERIATPLMRALEKLGVQARIRIVDPALYEARLKSFEFDVTGLRLPGQLNPGGEQYLAFHSSQAQARGSNNVGGAADPAVDALISALLAAKTRPALVAAARALDRVLRHGHYMIPHWYSPVFRMAYRGGRFAQPAVLPKFYEAEDWALATWWNR